MHADFTAYAGLVTCIWLRGREGHSSGPVALDQGEEADPLQRGWVGADGNECCPNCFRQAMPRLPLSGRRIGLSKSTRKLAVSKRCALRLTHWSLDCDHTDAGDPWCVIYDEQHHRIVLHIARIERRYVVVWPWESRSAETTGADCGGRDACEQAEGLREGVVGPTPERGASQSVTPSAKVSFYGPYFVPEFTKGPTPQLQSLEMSRA